MNNTLILNKEIYNLQYINMAILAYKEIADIKITSDDIYFTCIFDNCMYEYAITMREFENYLITLTNRSISDVSL